MPLDGSRLTGKAFGATRWLVFLGEAAAVLIWFLLVLANLYGVPSLAAHELFLDGVFLLAVVVVLAARFTRRYGLARTAVVVFAIVLACAAAAAGEVGVRYRFRNVHSSGIVGDYFGWHATMPPLQINTLGFREREIPPKSRDRYRIAVVGDSFTWGQGIDASARYSNLIQDDLGKDSFEVFNFGISGTDMPEHIALLPKVLATSPDFILLQLYFNDFEMPGMVRPSPYPLLPSDLDRALERSSVTYTLLNVQWARLQEAMGIVETRAHWEARNLQDPNSPYSRQGFGMLSDFIDQSLRAKVGVGIVFFPFPDHMGQGGSEYPYRYLDDRVADMCKAKGIPCLDLLQVFSTTFKDPRVMWVSPFDAHPNELANRRAAYEIMARFGSIWHGGASSASARALTGTSPMTSGAKAE